jgi:hemerythrin
MTDFLTWREEWDHGIDWVDRDHREMVQRLNRLAAACTCLPDEPDRPDPRCRDQVLAALDALIEHNRRHFQSEEAFLRQIAYPGYEEHRREHVMQMAEFLDLRRDLVDDFSRHLRPATLEEFKHWFFNHVISEDRLYAEFYRAAGGETTDGRRSP